VLAEFEELGVVTRFESDGRAFGVVRNFGKFQKPKHPSYRHPLPDDLRTYAGFKASDSPSPPPVLPPDYGKPAATGVGVGKGEEKEPIAQRSTAEAAPLDYDHIQARVLEANGIADFRAEKSPGLMNLGPIIALMGAGFDLEADIVSGIRLKPNATARTWGYFEGQIRDFRDKRVGALRNPAPADQATITDTWPLERWQRMVTHWRETGNWNREALGPAPNEPDCRAPPQLIQAIAA